MNKIEQVRDALESVKRSIAFDVQDWSTDKRLAWIYGIIMGWGDASDEVARKHRWTAEDVATMQRHRAAIAILKDMDGQEPVAWMYKGGDSRYPAYLTLEKDIAEEDADDPSSIIPLYAHPSPSAPVDIAEVIKAGEEVVKKLWEANDMACIGPNPTDTWHAEKNRVISAWTTATAKHRTA
jgi:hypothetical protein